MSKTEREFATESTRTIDLPERLVTRIEARLPRTDFENPEGYVTFALEEVLATVEAETTDENYDAVDGETVESRLQSLGYLDE